MKIIVLLFFLCLCLSGSVNAQTESKNILLLNAAGNSITIGSPVAVTNNTILFPGTLGLQGAIPYISSVAGSIGTTTWLNPGTNGYVLTLSGGIPSWSNPASVNWQLAGNTGTTPGVAAGQNYLGTSDAKNLIFATSATERMRILSTGNISINSATAPQAFTIGGDIGIVGTGSKVTSSGTANELIMEETTDTYGTSRLRMQDRNGSNGALFEQIENAGNPGVDLVDFGFKPGTKVQSNIRLEARTAVLRGTPNITSATATEFQFLFGSTTTPQYVLSIGQGATLLEAGNFGIGYSAGSGTFPVASPLEMLDVHTGNIILSNTGTAGVSGTAGILKFQGTRDGLSTFQAGAQASNTFNYTLPTATPVAGQVLSANSVSGATPYAVGLSWATPLTIPISNTSNTTTTLLSLTNSSTTTGAAGNFVITSGTNTSTALTASTAGTAGTAFSATASGNGGANGHLYGILGIATNTTQAGNTNAGTGIRGEGNNTTTDANSNIALQIINGEFVVGRQASSVASDNTAGNNILVANEDDNNGLNDQGPSGVVDVTDGGIAGATGNTINSLQVFNRYAKAHSIILLVPTDGGTATLGASETMTYRVITRANGSFKIEVRRLNAAAVGAGGAAGTFRFGFLIVNPGK